MLLSYVLGHLSRGTLPGDLRGTPTGSLWIGVEDAWEETVLPALVATGADVARIHRVIVKRRGDVLDIARDAQALGELMERRDARVVAFEAIVDHLVGVDDYKNTEVRQALAPAVHEMRERGGLMLATTHLNKSTKGDFRHRVMGSGAYLAVARVGLLVATHPRDKAANVLALGKGNLGVTPSPLVFSIEGAMVRTGDGDQEEHPRVSWDSPPYHDDTLTIDEVLDAEGHREQRTRLTEASDFLVELLADGAMASKDVEDRADGEGISRSTLARARKTLRVRVRKDGETGAWMMALPTPEDAQEPAS